MNFEFQKNPPDHYKYSRPTHRTICPHLTIGSELKKVTEKVISSFSALSNNLTRSINRLINERKAKRRRIHHRDIQVTQHLLAPKKVSFYFSKQGWSGLGELRVNCSKIGPTLFCWRIPILWKIVWTTYLNWTYNIYCISVFQWF